MLEFQYLLVGSISIQHNRDHTLNYNDMNFDRFFSNIDMTKAKNRSSDFGNIPFNNLTMSEPFFLNSSINSCHLKPIIASSDLFNNGLCPSEQISDISLQTRRTTLFRTQLADALDVAMFPAAALQLRLDNDATALLRNGVRILKWLV